MTLEKKKRGRKPKVKEEIEKTVINNNIVYLKLTKQDCDNINNSISEYDNTDIYYNFENLKEVNNNKNIIYKLKTYPYDNTISNNNIKNIYCYWCCHPFNSTVFTLPLKIVKDTYHVYGSFCSPECACAYNFDSCKEQDKKWERYSLLNLLYRKLLSDNKIEITSALPRESLIIFGGNLTIEEFRKKNQNYNKKIEILEYPLVSHTSIQNEIDLNYYLETKDKKNYIPLDNTKLDDIKDNLKIKRTKPLNNYKNTLESCMNLKYN